MIRATWRYAWRGDTPSVTPGEAFASGLNDRADYSDQIHALQGAQDDAAELIGNLVDVLVNKGVLDRDDIQRLLGHAYDIHEERP